MAARKAAFENGKKFGDWTVIEQFEQPVATTSGQVRTLFSRVRCICGTEKVLQNNYLRAGHSNGCGCRRGRAFGMGSITHGKSYTRVYKLWASIKHRLKTQAAYQGVRMYGPWEHDFPAFDKFIESLGPLPTPQHTLDRIDSSGHYEPGNLRWADKATQSANRRNAMSTNLLANSFVQVGQTYDMLTVLEVLVIERNGQNWYGAKVKCECGTIKDIYQKQLLSPKTKSCGCFKNRNIRLAHKALEKPILVGDRSLSMRAWAREVGVSVQVIWNRINKLGWDPARAVTTPLRESQHIEVNGESLTAADWCKRHGVPALTIMKRIKKGWDPAEAVTKPVRAWEKIKPIDRRP